MPAMTALRMLMSSNGGTSKLNDMKRPPPEGISRSWSFFVWKTCLRIAGGGVKSPLTRFWPSTI